MIIKCSSCGSRYRVSDDLVADGPKKFKCKNCGAVLLIKPPSSSVPAAEKKSAPEEKAPPPPAAADTPRPEVEEEKAGETAAESTERESAPEEQESPAETSDEENADGADEQDGDSGDSESEENESSGPDDSDLTPEEIAARQQQDIQEKLEKRRQQMEDEISGRLNKAALETLDFEVLTELAEKIQGIQHNPDFHMEEETKLFSCIKCKTTFCIYPDDSRVCSNCSGEVTLVRADDILKQYGMFG